MSDHGENGAGATETTTTVKFEGVAIQPAQDVQKIPTFKEVRANPAEYAGLSLVQLDAVKPKEEKHTMMKLNSYYSICYIIDSSEQIQPPRENPYDGGKQESGQMRLNFSTCMLNEAPAVKLSYTILRGIKSQDKMPDLEHRGSLIWTFADVHDHQTGMKRLGMRSTFTCRLEQIDAPAPAEREEAAPPVKCLVIEFDSDYCTTENLSTPAGTPLTEEEQHVMGLINDMAKTNGTSKHIRLKVYPFYVEVDKKKKKNPQAELDIEELAKILPGGSQALDIFKLKNHFNAYRHDARTGDRQVHVQFGATFNRDAIINAGAPFCAHPYVSRFLDKDHVEVVLGYGSVLEWQEAKRVATSISNDQHVASLHRFGSSVIASVKFHVRPNAGLGSDVYSIPENTKAKLFIKSNVAKDDIEAEGMVIAQDIDITPPGDIQVLLVGSEAQKIAFLAKKGPNAGGERFAVRLEAKLSDTVVEAQVDAVRKMCTALPSDSPWLSLVLYNGDTTDTTRNPIYNPWKGLPDQEQVKAALEGFANVVPWNEAQRQAIKASQDMRLRTALVSGPGGSGKTELQAQKSVAIMNTNSSKQTSKVLFVSERNAACDNIFDRVVELNPQVMVVRAYAHQESAYKVNDDSPAAARDRSMMSQEELALLEIIDEKLSNVSSKQYGRGKYSAEAWVIHKAKNPDPNSSFKITFTTSHGQPDAEFPNGVDGWTFFAGMLDDLRKDRDRIQSEIKAKDAEGRKKDATSTDKSKGAGKSDKSTDDHRRFKQAFYQLREEVIRQADIIVSTVANAGSEVMKKNFASGEHDRVWLEVDEATTIHEASMYIPLAKCFGDSIAKGYGSKIVSLSMYGDEKQLGPVVLGSNGANKTPAYNEFGSQIRMSLFSRLIDTGFPVNLLHEQARSHPEIFNLANKYFYGSKILSTGTDFALPENYERVVLKARGCDDGDFMTEAQLRMLYFEVPGSTHMKISKDSGSRANMRSLNTVCDLVENQLTKIWGDDMHKRVAIITPYARQKQLYSGKFSALRRKGVKASALPQVLTVDSAIGREFDHVVIDLVNCTTAGNGLGFCNDSRRNCVTFTRGRKAMWIVGSDFGGSESDGKEGGRKAKKVAGTKETIPAIAFVYYHREMAKAGCTISEAGGEVADVEWPIDFWPDMLEQCRDELVKEGYAMPVGSDGFVTFEGEARTALQARVIEKREAEG